MVGLCGEMSDTINNKVKFQLLHSQKKKYNDLVKTKNGEKKSIVGMTDNLENKVQIRNCHGNSHADE